MATLESMNFMAQEMQSLKSQIAHWKQEEMQESMPYVMENIPLVSIGMEIKPKETLLGSDVPSMVMPLGFHLVSIAEPMFGHSPIV